jgi:secondary thiamine-phosphate synthase enzyme
MAVTLSVRTQRRSQMVEITDEVSPLCVGVASGYVIVYVPHTTAGVIIQENADPDVQHDLLKKLDTLVPKEESYYRHGEL